MINVNKREISVTTVLLQWVRESASDQNPLEAKETHLALKQIVRMP